MDLHSVCRLKEPNSNAGNIDSYSKMAEDRMPEGWKRDFLHGSLFMKGRDHDSDFKERSQVK